MRNRISAIIIDPEKSKHNYKDINTANSDRFNIPWGEREFDLLVLKDTKHILKELSDFRGFDCLITIGNDIDFEPLNNLPIQFRNKWSHIDEFNSEFITNIIVDSFLLNINRESSEKTFSIFTCTYKTDMSVFYRLYNSLLNQTYKNWNWTILDDSPTNSVSERLASVKDPRITIIKNVTNHGSIGFNKRIAALSCTGDYLVEIDHDDELTSDCLEKLLEAFEKYPDADFAYSYAFENVGGEPVYYGEDFAYGLGRYEMCDVNGQELFIATTPDVNAVSVRAIQGLPNHVRCWKSEFYRKIGGHNPELSVLDDMDILIRTFLYGRMVKIEKVLYIQHEGPEERGTGTSNTQSKRFLEIQRTNEYLRFKYNKQIHERILELGGDDPCWGGEDRPANMYIDDCKNLKTFNYTL